MCSCSKRALSDRGASYRAGEHINALAKRFGMQEQTVKASVRRAGVPFWSWPKLSPVVIEETVRLYEVDGWSFHELGDSLIATLLRCDVHSRSGYEDRHPRTVTASMPYNWPTAKATSKSSVHFHGSVSVHNCPDS
jgi:hypothetical protein